MIHLRLFAAAALGLAVLALGGCVSMPAERSDAAVNAEALFRQGDLSGAAQAFMDAAQNSRRDRNRYLLRAAEAWRENADLESMRSALIAIEPRRLNGDEPLRFALLQAELALESGDTATALALLDPRLLTTSPAQQARFHELRGRALESADPLAAAAEFARLDRVLRGRERRDNVQRVRALLAKLDDRELRDLSGSMATVDPLRPFAVRALTSRGLAIPAQLRDARANPLGNMPQAATGAGRIALLLPLTGPLSVAARPVRDGFLAARFAAGDRAAEVVLVDAGETPESAIAGYRTAVSMGAEQVVGPIGRESVSRLFAEEELNVPIMALNRSGTPPPPGHMSFALTPEDEAIAIARLFSQRGLQRVVAVAGPDEQAQRALEAFSARHQQAGGELLATVRLPETGVNYQPLIRSALSGAGLPTSSPISLSVAHDPGFDAVFMAVRPSQARLLVPQLKIAGLIDLPMVGTSALHAIDDDSRLDRELDGVEFTELPWLVDDLPGLPSRSALQAELDSATGASARLFAFGLDAWRVLQAQGALMGADLPLPAATGDLSVDAFGEVRSQPHIARFRSGRARLVESGALRSD